MTISAAQQRNAVSEGMALGLCMSDRSEFHFDKFRIDLSFENAWSDWDYCDHFPQVNTDLRNGTDAVWVMTYADIRKQVSNFYWDHAGTTIHACARPRWADEEIDADAIAGTIGDGAVPAAGWYALAQNFLGELDR